MPMSIAGLPLASEVRVEHSISIFSMTTLSMARGRDYLRSGRGARPGCAKFAEEPA
jgi:hypothetical protein